MKHLLTLLLTTSAMLLSATAHSHDLLVGSYTDGTSEGIYRYRFDSTTGRINTTPQQVLKSSNPSWLTLSPDHRWLFAVNENGAGKGEVSSFSIDPNPVSHVLSPLNQVPSKGDEPTHSSLSHDGKFLFVANYGVQPVPGGSLSVLPVAADGRLSAPSQQLQHQASHVNPERQAGPHVHSVVSSRDGREVFVSDLGADKVFIYRYDPSHATTPLSPANPEAIHLPPGSGPRHLLFSRDGAHAYLTLEMSAQVAVFDYRDGTLVPRQIVDLTAQTEPAAKAAGALHLSADGRFLYVSNRGTTNELVVFVVNEQDGSLQFLQRRSVEGDHPREFALDPSEGYVLIANQKSNQIVVIKRDPLTGLLGDTLQTLEQAAPSDLKFID
ncbi:lactonase family protein [Pseudomonas fontis]|uniref:Lactonase family protein n=1 Tax=Pseudomonas fontis TaxID=2942633 RepID=A0ABT5NVK8_9PSED|nr:lactonase family protein [Pseudomonas fontis]MDD0975243.1 lactonase family protein [Pseudomonas fontis]MDD0992213.1 lactonase family protein [Pseudomonas fontis]